MSDQTYTVRHRKRAYDGFVRLDLYEATITRGDQTVEMVREVQDHGHGATVLPYDPTRKTCLLVRQLRLPIYVDRHDGLHLEAAAGLSDPQDASPLETARREGAEELGYALENLEHISTFYTIPGLVTERMSAFLATYSPDGRVDVPADDDEVLDVEEWPLAELWRAFEDGRLTDVKAIVCLMALKLRRPELFAD